MCIGSIPVGRLSDANFIGIFQNSSKRLIFVSDPDESFSTTRSPFFFMEIVLPFFRYFLFGFL